MVYSPDLMVGLVLKEGGMNSFSSGTGAVSSNRISQVALPKLWDSLLAMFW